MIYRYFQCKKKIALNLKFQVWFKNPDCFLNNHINFNLLSKISKLKKIKCHAWKGKNCWKGFTIEGFINYLFYFLYSLLEPQHNKVNLRTKNHNTSPSMNLSVLLRTEMIHRPHLTHSGGGGSKFSTILVLFRLPRWKVPQVHTRHTALQGDLFDVRSWTCDSLCISPCSQGSFLGSDHPCEISHRTSEWRNRTWSNFNLPPPKMRILFAFELRKIAASVTSHVEAVNNGAKIDR